jgi:hypothetical protein
LSKIKTKSKGVLHKHESRTEREKANRVFGEKTFPRGFGKKSK